MPSVAGQAGWEVWPKSGSLGGRLHGDEQRLSTFPQKIWAVNFLFCEQTGPGDTHTHTHPSGSMNTWSFEPGERSEERVQFCMLE